MLASWRFTVLVTRGSGMRSHGWSGNVPASDQEAIDRILDAAEMLLSEPGSVLRIADVARELGVTRPTVYRYFSSVDEVILGCAVRSADGLLDQLIAHLKGETDPVKAIVEGMGFAVESMTGDSQIGMAYVTSPSDGGSGSVLSHTATAFGRSMLDRLDVDWNAYGYSEQDLGELTEFCLRTLHSQLADPGDPPRTGDQLRRYLVRWMGPVIEYPRMVLAVKQMRELETIMALRS